jgi:hypothetical protein
VLLVETARRSGLARELTKDATLVTARQHCHHTDDHRASAGSAAILATTTAASQSAHRGCTGIKLSFILRASFGHHAPNCTVWSRPAVDTGRLNCDVRHQIRR